MNTSTVLLQAMKENTPRAILSANDVAMPTSAHLQQHAHDQRITLSHSRVPLSNLAMTPIGDQELWQDFRPPQPLDELAKRSSADNGIGCSHEFCPLTPYSANTPVSTLPTAPLMQAIMSNLKTSTDAWMVRLGLSWPSIRSIKERCAGDEGGT